MRPRLPRTVLPPEKVVTLDIGAGEEAIPGAPKLKVLLLEDRNDFRGVLHEFLVACSYKVTSAASGIEGLREIMKNGFDVIICDMMMPEMGGEMFYWAVTAVRPGTRERFIFFTGHKNNPRIEFFFRRVNARVVYKPFKLSVLESAIRDVSRKVR
jgi:CheY-like chemotaxis protein